MKDINFHIAYLLTKHECVVIPGFGALIMSFVPASKKEREGMFSPPIQLLSFNPEIKHNDGFLTNFLSVIKAISYKEADSLIKQYVNQLNDLLSANKTVDIQWIGNFSLSAENKIIFTPSAHLSCNAINFGLNHFSLPSLKELKYSDPVSVETNDRSEIITISVHRRTLAWSGSVAAAVLALFLVSTPLNNNSGQRTQNASFFSTFQSLNTQKIGKEKTVSEETILRDTTLMLSDTATILQSQTSIVQASTVQTVSRYYYIVIASLPTEKAALNALPYLQKEGFAQPAVISRGGKHRIYINRFEKKKEAESYLETFRRNNPEYADAWLLSLPA